MKNKIIFSDFDGTLLNDKGQISERDLTTLEKLRKKGIMTVLATGRSIFSLSKVINPNFPIDYVVFSCGAGIIDWPHQKVIYKRELPVSQVNKIINLLLTHNSDFMIHNRVPHNHKFLYSYNSEKNNEDFFNRIKLYNSSAQEYKPNLLKEDFATQVVSIFPKHDFENFETIKAKFSEFSVIRATSPLDNLSLWMEIFHKEVSKSQTAEKLVSNILETNALTFAIGNDYNDLDLLKWADYSYIVENSPEDLKKRFKTTSSNNENGFSQAVEDFLSIVK